MMIRRRRTRSLRLPRFEPKEILGEYTALTGKSPMPPLWSFGMWMSRCTYDSEKEVREVAAKLRANNIPCDVLHLDTGWFETDWRCDYEFSKNAIPVSGEDDPGPQARTATTSRSGSSRTSCRRTTLFPEIVERTSLCAIPRATFPRRRHAGLLESRHR
jgi:hypothetical protein